MALETGTYISDLVSTNPASGDNVSQGDDHLRLIKATVKATFPNISGEVTPTHTQINSALGNFVSTTSFTPKIIGTTNAGTGTYSNQEGRYSRIGNLIFFTINVTWTEHTGTGNLRIEGLPVASAAGVIQPVGPIQQNVTFTAGNVGAAWIGGSSTQIVLLQVPTGGGAAANVPMDTAGTVYVSGFYEVA